MMPAQKPIADPSVIKDHLRHVFRRWHEIDVDCVFEVRLLTSEDEASVKNVARFRPSEDGISEASDHIAAMNAYGLNAYIVVNPIRANADIKAGHAAKDEHIAAAFFHWADADDAQAAENIRTFVGPRPTFFVLTGKSPCPRPHVYWELEKPETDLVAWKARQQAIAATLKSDPSVVNPSRIMRVGGTVNWPKPKKIAKGYIQEVTELHIHSQADRPLVSADRMTRAFIAAPQQTTGTGFHIDTGEADRKSADQYSDILRRARTDGEKHTGVRDLAASLAGAGVPRPMAESIIREACPVWDEGVVKLIDTAYAKFAPPTPYTQNFDHAPAAPDSPAPGWRVQSAQEFVKGFVAPEYLIDGVIQRGRLYTLTAPTGSGKTAVMLYAGVAMSEGQQVCGLDTEQGDVIYMAGENPDDVRARVIMTLEQSGIEGKRLHFIPGTFSIRKDMDLLKAAVDQLPNVTLIVVDTLAAYFDGDDANSNAQMLDFARVLRRLTETRTKPAVIVPAHPVKNAAKTNLTPMGGSALLNEVDGNLCLWKRETAVELHWQGKHRGAEFEPLMFELKMVKSDTVKDSKGRVMPSVVAVPLFEARAYEIAKSAYTMKERLLLSIEDNPALSIVQRCTDIHLVNSTGNAKKSSLVNMLRNLTDEKLIKSVLSNWYLTEKGEKAVQIIRDGGSPVDIEL